MRKKIIGIFGILAVVFLSVIFIWNYRRINQMYPNPELLKAGIGEPEELDGYEFTLTDFQMTDGEEMKSILANVQDVYKRQWKNCKYRLCGKCKERTSRYE